MTAEHTYKLYRAYKFYYAGKVTKFGVLRHPPLIQQFDRSYYYRISRKLNDAQIHALYTEGFFYNPTAHISALCSPEAQRAALVFAGRAENGIVALHHDLYDLRKRILDDLDGWLYGSVDEGRREVMPGCVGEIISRILPLDLACILLLVPQPTLSYNWSTFMAAQPDFGLGPHQWIDRLRKVDQLLYLHRPDWRTTMQTLAREFWHSLGIATLAPTVTSEPSVF